MAKVNEKFGGAERRNKFRRESDRKIFEAHQALERQLEAVKDEMERLERMKPLASIASSVVHDIRNSLGIISSTAQFVLSKMEQADQMKQSWEMVLRNVDTIQKILKSYLGLARQVDNRKEPVSVNDIVEHVIKYVDNQTQKAGIAVKKELDASVPNSELDVPAIESAVLNIVINAIDVMEKGGTLTFSTAHSSGQKSVTIQVRDTGAGISEKNLVKIFSPFFTTKDKGTGMGLYSAKMAVENNGGTISCESKPGTGTMMALSFPAVRKSG